MTRIRAVVGDAEGNVRVVEGEAVPSATCEQCSAPLTPTPNGGGHCIRHGFQVVERYDAREVQA